MKALRYFGPRSIRCETMDDPVIQDSRDAIIKVDRCAICGSDLHIYHGEGFSEDLGFCVGPEAVGEVVETGAGVHRLKVGDKVMISAAVGCGACASCLAGNVIHCANNAAGCYGLSSRLQGCQAEAVRVPAADFNAALIPEGVTADQALMMTHGLVRGPQRRHLHGQDRGGGGPWPHRADGRGKRLCHGRRPGLRHRHRA